MSRWFRHYASLCRDEKLVSVAIKSKQSIERVVWVWCAILESAAEIDNDGRYDIDAAEIAYFLRADEADIHAVLGALELHGRIHENVVVKWGDRQFSSDRSRDRVAAYRERRRAEHGDGNEAKPSRNDGVTLQKRYCNAPETETETDTEKDISSLRSDTAPEVRPPAKPKASFNARAALLELGCDEKHIDGWITVRKAKRAPLTEAALDDLKREAAKANIPVAYAVQICAAKGWQGFNAGWNFERPSSATGDILAKQKAMIAAMKLDHLESVVGRYFAKQWQWNSVQMGPPPDRPGTLIPPEIIDRARHTEGQKA